MSNPTTGVNFPRKVFLDDLGEIPIDPSARLGSGSFATVFKHADRAVKLWNVVEPGVVAKVDYMLKNLGIGPESSSFAPLSFARKFKAGDHLGFSMGLVPANSWATSVLFNWKQKAQHKITHKHLGQFLTRAVKDLDQINQMRLVVVDLSARNLLFTLDHQQQQVLTPAWIDVDSWFLLDRSFNEPVNFTFEFVDPLFVDPLTKQRVSRPAIEHNHYSLAVIAFWMLLNYHPFGGTHSSIPDTELGTRISRRIWALDNAVEVPGFGYKPEVITDELMQDFYQTFVKDQRQLLPLVHLEQYAQSLIQCKSCDHWYPQMRRACPFCQEQTVAPVPTLSNLKELITSSGLIVRVAFHEGTILAIAYERGQVVAYAKPKSGPATRHPLFPEEASLRFEIVGTDTVAVNRANSSEIELWQLTPGGARPVLTTTTEGFLSHNNAATFRGSSSGLIRIAGARLLAGGINFGQLVERILPIDIHKHQTWFWADETGRVQFGVFQFFEQQLFWLINRGSRYEVELPQLLAGEELVDTSVRFGQGTIIVRRLTKLANESYLRTAVVDLKGRLIHSPLPALTRTLKSSRIRGIAYSDVADELIVWHPTDEGVIRETLKTGEFQTIMQTKAVNSVDSLIHLGGGKHFLVIRPARIDYLVLN